jgi:hypothetical protein
MIVRAERRLRALRCGLRLVLAAGLLASCAELPPAPRAPAPREFVPGSAPGAMPLAVGVLIAGWHSGLVLPVRELGPLAPLVRRDRRARYVSFGWGNRRFYMSARPGSGDALAALWRSRSALLIEAARTPTELAWESGTTLRWLCVTRAQLWKIDVYLEDSLTLRAGQPIDLGPGPLPQSTFYASTGHYDALHTCNTWTVAALEYAGLPAVAAGVILSSQVGDRIAGLPVCAATPSSQQLGVARQIDIAAAHQHADALARAMKAPRERRRRPQAPRWLDHELHALGEKAHGLDQHRIAHRDDVGNQRADDREVALTEVGRERAVGDRVRHGNAHDLSGAQRLLAVVAGLGLDPDHAAAWARVPHGDRRSREQAPASQGHE